MAKKVLEFWFAIWLKLKLDFSPAFLHFHASIGKELFNSVRHQSIFHCKFIAILSNLQKKDCTEELPKEFMDLVPLGFIDFVLFHSLWVKQRNETTNQQILHQKHYPNIYIWQAEYSNNFWIFFCVKFHSVIYQLCECLFHLRPT